MKKVGILTFHAALNYGALLQAFALQQALTDQGDVVEIIDYRNPIIDNMYYYPGLFERKNVRDVIKYILQGKSEKRKRAKFEEFRRQKLTISAKRYTNENIQSANNEYDLFVTGSDQVWNYMAHGFDKNFFLSFVDCPEKKRSYAASIGLSELPDDKKNEYAKLLQDYPICSVREKQGVDILARLGIQSRRLDIDPTLLLDKNEWCKRLAIKQQEQNYILAYYFQLTPTLKKFIEELSERTGCCVVYLGSALKDPFLCKCKAIKSADPVDFVTTICNAKYVVTNSFHGTAFSINFQKTFFVELLKKDSQVNSRITNILNETGLLGQQISSFETIQEAKDCYIDWNVVNKKIQKLRENSDLYIREWLV